MDRKINRNFLGLAFRPDGDGFGVRFPTGFHGQMYAYLEPLAAPGEAFLRSEIEWASGGLGLITGEFKLGVELLPDSLWIFYNMRIPEIFFFETFYAEAGVTNTL